MILSRVKRLLQSVEEASTRQVAADLGVDQEIAAASLEHLCVMGKVTRREPRAGLEPGDGALCRERVGCASCPLVRVCDPQAEEAAIPPEPEGLYSWVVN